MTLADWYAFGAGVLAAIAVLALAGAVAAIFGGRGSNDEWRGES